ncbi:5280_t:CDS:2, partial [Acaulospora morrowiae]
EESGLSEIVKKEIKCANIEYRKIDWKTIQSEFNIKFRLNRNIKSLQEKYNKHLRADVYISDSEGKRRSYPFTGEHVELILSAKLNELGRWPWKFLSEEINKHLPISKVRCTPNQVKNKYHTEKEKQKKMAGFALIDMSIKESLVNKSKTLSNVMRIENLLN